jgi:hypothetical protein
MLIHDMGIFRCLQMHVKFKTDLNTLAIPYYSRMFRTRIVFVRSKFTAVQKGVFARPLLRA